MVDYIAIGECVFNISDVLILIAGIQIIVAAVMKDFELQQNKMLRSPEYPRIDAWIQWTYDMFTKSPYMRGNLGG